MFKFKQDEKVKFKIHDLEGTGIVVGCSTTEIFLLGRMYIVEVHTCRPALPSNEYPFTTVTIPEIHIESLS